MLIGAFCNFPLWRRMREVMQSMRFANCGSHTVCSVPLSLRWANCSPFCVITFCYFGAFSEPLVCATNPLTSMATFREDLHTVMQTAASTLGTGRQQVFPCALCWHVMLATSVWANRVSHGRAAMAVWFPGSTLRQTHDISSRLLSKDVQSQTYNFDSRLIWT